MEYVAEEEFEESDLSDLEVRYFLSPKWVVHGQVSYNRKNNGGTYLRYGTY